MPQSKWFSDMALRLESFYIQNNTTIQQVSTIGRIWGTRVEDLKNPVGVAGRVLRTIPEAINLARGFTREPNNVYAKSILYEDLPHVFIGSMGNGERFWEQDNNSPNPHAHSMAGLLKGLASVLNLKYEEIPFFHNSKGEMSIWAFKIYLGPKVTLGILQEKDALGIYSPLFSSHDAATTRQCILDLWSQRGIVGINIGGGEKQPVSRRSLADCTITQITKGESLVIGNDFANDYKRIAKRIQRFEKAGYNRNLMLLGPPGCGKTSIAQEIAQEIGRFIVSVESSLLSDTVLIAVLTHFFPDVILICDDFDRYHGDTQTLLASLERTGASLIVTCNTIYGFDKATVRVGRIDEIIDVPKPNEDMRRRLFDHFNASKQSPTAEEYDRIVEETEGFTPAEMREVAKCWEVLGFTDCTLEIKRLRRQSKLAENLLYKLDWAKGTPDNLADKSADADELEKSSQMTVTIDYDEDDE